MNVNTQHIETNSEAETIAFAQDFAKDLSAGDIVLLQGDLGMGKSVFSRAVIKYLCDDEHMDVPSPTFTLVQTYDAAIGDLWHFDLYRLNDPSEVYETGWEEAISGGIVLVEWPERLGALKPTTAIDIILSGESRSPEKRIIEVIKHGI